MKKHAPQNQKNQAGFAIVATVSITSLALISSLAIVALSTETTKNTGYGYHQRTAQANAKIALNEALSQLQYNLGPDKKVTVPSTIYDGYAHDHTQTISQYTSSEIVHHNWIAVLDSKDTIALEGGDAYYRRYCGNPTNARFKRWLVSGIDAVNRESASYDFPTGTESIKIVGQGTLGASVLDTDKRIVFVALDSITNEVGTSKYGWWIGDNSLKAAIRHQRPMKPVSDLDKTILLSSGANTDPSALPALSFLDTSFTSDVEYLSKSLTLKTLDLHSSAPTPSSSNTIGSLFHDLTLESRGLLVNNSKGKLQLDLSRLFAGDSLPSAFTDSAESVQSLTKVRSLVPRHTLYESLVGNVPSGSSGFNSTQADKVCTGWGLTPTWERLHAYHKISNDVTTTSSPKFEFNASTLAAIKELECKPPLPIVTRLQWFVSATAGLDNRLAYVVEPVITFWNPYNVELAIDPAACQFVLHTYWPALKMKGFQNGTAISPYAGTNEDTYLQIRNSFSPIYSQNTGMYFQFDGMTLKPGETKVYSDANNTPNDWNQVWDASGIGANYFGNTNPINAAPGWTVNGGHKGDGRSWGSYNYNGTLLANQTLSVDISPNKPWNKDWLGGWSDNMSMHHQLDLSEKTSTGRQDYMNGIQAFMANNQSASDMVSLWGLGSQTKITRSGISTNALLAGEKIPLCVIDTAVRTEQDGDFQGVPYVHTSQVHGDLLINNNSNAQKANSFWTSRLKLVTSWASNTVEIDSDNRGFFGPGNTAATGYNFYTARELPTAAPMCHAAYKNFDLLFSPHGLKNSWRSELYRGDKKPLSSSPSWYAVGPSMQKIVGNSFASPMIPRGLYMHTSGDDHFVDHSIVANATLYGNYFHSGLDPMYLGSGSSFRARMANILEGKELSPLANLIPVSTTTIDAAVDELEAPETGYKAVAKHFMLDGSFNINSTSIHAWRALLRGLRRQDVPYQTANGSSGIDLNNSTTPFPNMMKPTEAGIDSSASESAQKWTGYLKLSDSEIDTLAENIVEQVKKRGPFLNLSEFINRYPTSELYSNKAQTYVPSSERSDLSLAGAIQTAINESNINHGLFPTTNSASDVSSSSYLYPEAAQISRGTGAPTFLTQSDILQAVGNRLTTRGDTFTVRAYGDSRNADGDIMSTAYIEATLQRCLDYVDITDASDTAAEDLTSELNKNFGRRFKVINVRWLSKKEV